MIRVGVIGYGYWGPNLVRNFFDSPNKFEVVAVSDKLPERLDLIKARYPSVRVATDPEQLIRDPGIDAIAIATPVSTHFDLANRAMRAGKHVLVEKPMTNTVAEAEELVELARSRNLTLMVDHTFVYTGAVRKMRALVEKAELGDLYYYDSVRVNLGLFQHDVDVIWDLAVHDLAIMDYVIGQQPCAVSATGLCHIPGRSEDIAYVTMFFESSFIAHIHVNWLAPVKVRRTMIGGSRKMVVYDDVEPSEKIKVYDKGVTVAAREEDMYKLMISYRSGDMWAPQLDNAEALRAEIFEFAAAIEQNRQPLTGGEAGLSVVRTLEAATKSMKSRGQLIDLHVDRVTI